MKATHVEAVEEVVAGVLVVKEHLEVLEDALVDGHGVVVADGVLSEEVELDDELLAVLLFVQLHVFVAQRAAAHRVGHLLRVLLVSGSQRKLATSNTYSKTTL